MKKKNQKQGGLEFINVRRKIKSETPPKDGGKG